MKRIIRIALFVFIMGSVMGCQSKEEQTAPVTTEERTTAAAEEKTEEMTTEQKTEEASSEDKSVEGETEADAGGMKEDEKSLVNDGAAGSTEGKAAETNISAQSYYGKWKVTEYYAPYITAISGEEMNALIGAECEYAADHFISRGTNLDSPQYSESTEMRADFDEGYKDQITFDTLGIAADSVKQILVDNSYDFGSMFYVKNDNTIIIIYEGVFFEAVRE